MPRNRLRSDEKSRTNKLNSIQNEVQNLLKSGDKMDVEQVARLRSKYRDENIIDQINDSYNEQLSDLRRKARKFAKVIRRKYEHKPLNKLLRKAYKYKKHYKLSDGEFREFQRIYEQEMLGQNTQTSLERHRTRIGRTLGEPITTSGHSLKIDDDELAVLDQILQFHSLTQTIHNQVMLQCMIYDDCAPEALTGKIRDDKTGLIANPASHVHPIIAAMFLPKIKILEEHMLYSNIANIIKVRHEGKNIVTKPDYQVMYDLINDPNDIVCNVSSPLTDLFNRCALQKEIWEAVYNLRNGRYYHSNLSSFLNALNNCRVNQYDAPDLIYNQDEGAILRRILSAFSFRPTIVSTIPMSQMVVETNVYARQPVLTNVTSIPMINIRLPLNIPGSVTAAVDLEDSLTQNTWYLENGSVINKQQSIIYSKGVLFFYVNRRFKSVNARLLFHPRKFSNLPLTMSGYEKLNNLPVTFNRSIDIMGDTYNLRSVVTIKTSNLTDTKDLIIGSHALVCSKDSKCHYIYDPIGAAVTNANGESNDPITELVPDTGVEDFESRVRTRGTIFMYHKEADSGNNPLYY